MEIRRYVTDTGRDVVGDWLAGLNDPRTRAKITARLDRMIGGNFGDRRALNQGVWELRVDWGPGYRVYYAMAGRTCVLLLCGGDKRRQSIDIARANVYWKDYQRRTNRP